MLAVLSILAVLVAFVGCSSDAGKTDKTAPAGELSVEELLTGLNEQQADDNSGGALLTGSAIADVTDGVTWISCQDPETDHDDPKVKGTTVYVLETSDGTTQSWSATDR